MSQPAFDPDDNPQPGEVWEHRDGGQMYIVLRGGTSVAITRRPPGDSQAETVWLSLVRFHFETTGRLR